MPGLSLLEGVKGKVLISEKPKDKMKVSAWFSRQDLQVNTTAWLSMAMTNTGPSSHPCLIPG